MYTHCNIWSGLPTGPFNIVDSLKKEWWHLPSKMSEHECHGIKHVPLEGGIIHAAVENIGYISKGGTEGQNIFDDPT